MNLEHLVGTMGHAASVVNSDNTAVSVGSGALPVLSTPTLVGLVEQAAVHALSGNLPPGLTTVGTGIQLKHLAATPLGHNIHAEAVLVGATGRRLEFRIAAYDEREKIAEGNHERFVVEAERFMAKMVGKKPKGS